MVNQLTTHARANMPGACPPWQRVSSARCAVTVTPKDSFLSLFVLFGPLIVPFAPLDEENERQSVRISEMTERWFPLRVSCRKSRVSDFKNSLLSVERDKKPRSPSSH